MDLKAGKLWIRSAVLGLSAVVAMTFCQPLVSTAGAPTVSAVPDVAYPGAYVTNGDVIAIARSGNTTYIGGSFTMVGPRTGHGVPISTSTGALTSGFPDVAGGDVLAAVSDGSGGLVIGGDFTMVGGVTRNRVAHFNADGSLDTNWNPNANDTVRSLALSGTTVYAGGDFTQIGGQTRRLIAAINSDPASSGYGEVTTWNPNITGTSVNVAYSLGPYVLTGGVFSDVGGDARNNLASIRISDGVASAWNPSPDGAVNAVAFTSDGFNGRIYIGGGFSNIVGYSVARDRLAIFDSSNGMPVDMDRDLDGDVNAIQAEGAGAGANIYIAGAFTSILNNQTSSPEARGRIASLRTSDYSLNSFNPNFNDTVGSLSISTDDVNLYVGGRFTSVGGEGRNNIAAVDTGTGDPTSWNPSASSTVRALAVDSLDGSHVFVGGTFASIGARGRNRLAALDSSGQLTSWDPNANGIVNALESSSDGDTIYAGGEFTTVNGSTTRNGIAAFGVSTGTATGWNPNANNFVRALAVSGTTVFAGGDFTSIGGAARGMFSALDGTSGTALGGDVNADSSVNTIGINDGSVVAGGAFTSIGGQTRNRLAAFDLNDGSLQSWNPNANDVVRAVAFTDTAVIAGGDFTTIGGQARGRLAAIAPISGAPVGSDPNANDTVTALEVGGNSLFIGGAFTSIGGQLRNGLAASNLEGTQVLDWNPNADTRVNALTYSGSTLYAGGRFNTVGTQSNEGYAQFTAAPTNNAAPSISGSNVVGNTLTCSSGTWDDTYATLVYQWLKDGAPISGATNTTHSTSDADVGAAITCQVTATNIGGPSSATSVPVTIEGTPVTPVQPVTPAPTTGESGGPSLTKVKASPRCLRSRSLTSTSKRTSSKHGRTSRAGKPRKRPHSLKRTKTKREVGSKLKLKFTLSESSEVTISIRRRKGSHGPLKSCPSNRKKGSASEKPGQYEEVQRITQSVGAGSNSTSLSLSSKKSKKKSRSKYVSAAKTSKADVFGSSFEALDITNRENISSLFNAVRSEKQTAVEKKQALKSLAKQKGFQAVRNQVSTSFSRSASVGSNTVDVSDSSALRNLKPGTYKAYISAENAAGLESTTQTAKFWVIGP